MKHNIKITIGSNNNGKVIKQDVSYIYVFDEQSLTADHYEKTSYGDLEKKDKLVMALNYRKDVELEPSPSGVTRQGKKYDSLYAFKREIWDGGGQSIYEPVIIKNSSDAKTFVDYNISNNRWYEYVIQPSDLNEEAGVIKSVKKIVHAKWQYWSLTELHPVSGDKKKFTASPSDIWIFKYNVSPSEQTQNMAKSQQDNLSQYPVFSRGKKNNISSSVSCLLGSEMAPYNFVTFKKTPRYDENGNIKWVEEFGHTETLGGYTERKLFRERLTSNQKVDMLNMWREVAYSGNPKLIKDVKGQKFLVQITQSSNSVNDSWNKNPDTINFSFVEIGSLEGVTITGEGDNEAYNKDSACCKR